MSRLRNLIDFTELVSPVPGEGLENLVLAITERLGLSPQPSGRGGDSGRDILLTFQVREPLQHDVRWLVSCKDFAESNRSVGEADLPRNIEPKLREHGAQG